MERIAIVYNPYVLHLLYAKLRYLRRLLMRAYRATEDQTYMMDHCILNDWYAEILTKDVAVMQQRMQKEQFPLPLYYCHYEYYLFRISQVFRAPGDASDSLYSGRRYQCETHALKLMDNDSYRIHIQGIMNAYVEAFYFSSARSADHAAKSTEQRIDLFFHIKQTLEKEISEMMIDKENMLFFIEYDNELIATVFYIHLVEEFLCLQERKMTSLEPEPTIVEEYKFVKRKLYKKESIHIQLSLKEGYTTQTSPLHKLMVSLCQTFRDQVNDRIRYYAKHVGLVGSAVEEQSASASSWFSSSSSTATVVDKENKYVKNARSLNREYGLEKPLDDTVRLTRRGGATSHIGQSEFYGTKKKTETTSAVALPIFYLSVSEERVHYTHFLYRLVFELYLREGHKCGSNSNSKTCCLCEYYARGVGIKKLATFFLTCDEQIEDPEIEAGRIKYINQALEKLFIERGPPLTLCSYKTLANVFCLFESTPLRLKGVEACHSLIDIINPVQLLATLSTTVVLPKLEREMCRVLELCHLKLSLKKESVEVVPEREQALAMDIELLRLINDAIVDQQNDIRRYERSVCTGSETTELSLEMSRVLRKIYVAHIDVLCQLMAERLACVKF